MDLGRVAVLFQPRRQGQDADRGHAVGQDRKVRLAGDEVEAGGVNQGDAHGWPFGEIRLPSPARGAGVKHSRVYAIILR